MGFGTRAPSRLLRVAALSIILVVVTAGCTQFNQLSQRNPGSAAQDLVSTQRYANLLVEIDHPAGWAPHPVAIDTLKKALSEVTQKSNVEVKLTASIPASSKAYTYAEIRALEDTHRTHFSGGDTAVLYIVYVGGTSAENDATLGAAYQGTSLVMFKGRIVEASQGVFAPRVENIERAVLVHEFGHAAGLVNLGAKMVRAREDAEHTGHSNDKNSVMYWAVENSDGLLTLLTGGSGIPYQFTADDKADLKAMWV